MDDKHAVYLPSIGDYRRPAVPHSSLCERTHLFDPVFRKTVIATRGQGTYTLGAALPGEKLPAAIGRGALRTSRYAARGGAEAIETKSYVSRHITILMPVS